MTHNAWDGLGWAGLDRTRCPRIRTSTNVSSHERTKSTSFFLTTLPFTLHPHGGSCFFPRARRAPNFNNVGIMHASSRQPSHVRVPKQGSPVHDLHHAHRVQSIPCKMMPFASFAGPSSAWHTYNVPPNPAHRTRPLTQDDRTRGDGQGIQSRRNCNKPHHLSHVRQQMPEPATHPWP